LVFALVSILLFIFPFLPIFRTLSFLRFIYFFGPHFVCVIWFCSVVCCWSFAIRLRSVLFSSSLPLFLFLSLLFKCSRYAVF